MTAIDQNDQKPNAVRDNERPGGHPAPGSQPPGSGRDKPPSDGDAIAELGDELGGPA